MSRLALNWAKFSGVPNVSPRPPWAASSMPEKLKDDAGPTTIHLQGREVCAPGRKASLVFDLMDGADFTANGRQKVVTVTAVRQALTRLDATDMEPVKTRVLAEELAGAGASEDLIEGKERSLQRGAKTDFGAFVAHLGKGGHDATLWGLSTLNIKGVHG
jgi:hypothetical protein